MFRAIVFLLGMTSLIANATILSPAGVTQNTLGTFSGFKNPPSNWYIDYTFDQSGLTEGFASGVDDYNTYISGSPRHQKGFPGNSWFGNTTSGIIDFDLGNRYEVQDLALWSHGNSSNLIRDFTVYTSEFSNFSSSVNAGTFQLSNQSSAAQSFDVTDSLARYVRLEIASSYGSLNPVVSGLGEIAFNVSPVPVPATVYLFVSAMAGLGLARKKRR